ncbi:MAG: gamma-glutamylcyclotransferase family protein [Pseudonocardiaceae bacterium]
MATGDLFVYGTLIVDHVIRALLDRIPTHEPVIARGWRVAQLPDRLYPGLVHDGGYVPGRLYTDLTTREWATLDAFEDPTYTLTTIEVLPGPRPALAYIWPDEPLFDAWTVDTLSATDLNNYLEQCKVWRQRYEQNSSANDH